MSKRRTNTAPPEPPIRARTLAQAIRKAREARGLSRFDLAVESGTTIYQVIDIENRRRRTEEAARKVIQSLGLDAEAMAADLQDALEARLHERPAAERAILLEDFLRTLETGRASAGGFGGPTSRHRQHHEDVRLEGFEPPTPRSGTWCSRNSGWNLSFRRDCRNRWVRDGKQMSHSLYPIQQRPPSVRVHAKTHP